MTEKHEAEQTLTAVRKLRERAAAQAHGGAWLPAAVLAALLLLSAGLYTSPFHHPNEMTVDVPYWAGLPAEQRSPVVSYAFWFLGTPLAFGLIALWYHRRGRRVGMRVPWRWSVGAGLGALVALAVIAAVPVPLPQDVPLGALTYQQPSPGSVVLNGLLTPLLPLGVAIAALGLAEASRALVAAGAWVGLLAWLQCTVGVLSVPAWIAQALGDGTGPGSSTRYDSLPGPLLVAMALPLLAFAAIRALRARPPQA